VSAAGIASVIDGGSLLLAVPVALAAGAISFALNRACCRSYPVTSLTSPGCRRSTAQDTQARRARAASAGGATAMAASGGGGGVAVASPAVIAPPRHTGCGGRTVLGAVLFVHGLHCRVRFGGGGVWLRGLESVSHQRVLEQGARQPGSILLGLFFAGAVPQRWSGWLQRDARLHYRPTVGTCRCTRCSASYSASDGHPAWGRHSPPCSRSPGRRRRRDAVRSCRPRTASGSAFRSSDRRHVPAAMTAFGWIKRTMLR